VGAHLLHHRARHPKQAGALPPRPQPVAEVLDVLHVGAGGPVGDVGVIPLREEGVQGGV
jgi:hypothetical protein